jgi:hypothetical protein
MYKEPVSNSWVSSPFHRKICILLLVQCHCPTKSNLHLDSSFKTVIREPTLYILRAFHVPNRMSLFCHLVHLSNEFVQVQNFSNMLVFMMRCSLLLAQLPSWSITPCHLSAAAYSMHSQLKAVPPSTTRGHAMQW